MPSYKVKSKGFYGGELYDPKGKRRILNTDKPFGKNDMPDWVEPIKGESATQAKARKKAETEKAKAEKAKAEADKKEVDKVTFTQGANQTPATQTL